MKIILTATSPSIDSNVDPRFGRGAYLIVVDTDTLEWQAHPNPGVNASGGAGTQAAQFAANQKAEASHQRRFWTERLQRAPGCRHCHVFVWSKHHREGGHRAFQGRTARTRRCANRPGTPLARVMDENHDCQRQGRHGQDHGCYQPGAQPGSDSRPNSRPCSWIAMSKHLTLTCSCIPR